MPSQTHQRFVESGTGSSSADVTDVESISGGHVNFPDPLFFTLVPENTHTY